MKYTLEIQDGVVEEPLRARYAMIVPILRGMLFSTKNRILEQAGGVQNITFEMFCRIYSEHPGDYGICFEYALHAAIANRDPSIYPKVSHVMDSFCGIGSNVASILFGAEKSGVNSVLESTRSILTDESKVLPGTQARPTFLKRHIENVVAALRNENIRQMLPASVRGIWKADLFLGNPDTQYWVATTLKTNRADIEPAPGLRIAMYPEERPNEEPRIDGKLINCPLPYNGEFMQLFGASFFILKHLIGGNGKLRRAGLVYFHDQQVAEWLQNRAHFPVVEIIEALEDIKQVGLIREGVEDVVTTETDITVAAPLPFVNAY